MSLAKTYQTVALDLPGFGGSQTPQSTWGLDDYTRLIAAFLKKINIEPCAIIGHSNGGTLAIRGLAEGTLKTNKLVLIAAAGIRTSQPIRRLILKIVAKIGNVATIGFPKQQRSRLKTALYSAAGSDMMVVPQMEETFKRIVRHDVQADAIKLKLPVLLIYGAQDKAAPLSYGRIYQRLIEGSKLVIINDAGHFLHLDAPEKVSSEILEFLK